MFLKLHLKKEEDREILVNTNNIISFEPVESDTYVITTNTDFLVSESMYDIKELLLLN